MLYFRNIFIDLVHFYALNLMKRSISYDIINLRLVSNCNYKCSIILISITNYYFSINNKIIKSKTIFIFIHLPINSNLIAFLPWHLAYRSHILDQWRLPFCSDEWLCWNIFNQLYSIVKKKKKSLILFL